jgi:plastocyanin
MDRSCADVQRRTIGTILDDIDSVSREEAGTMNSRSSPVSRRLWICLGLLVLVVGVSGQSCAPPPADGGTDTGTDDGTDTDDGTGADGTGTDADADMDANITDVRMVGIAFVPKEVTIQLGQSVRWTNDDAVLHTATSGAPGDADAGAYFDSPLLRDGDTYTFTFKELGTYVYFCRTHPSTPAMVDAIIIVEP